MTIDRNKVVVGVKVTFSPRKGHAATCEVTDVYDTGVGVRYDRGPGFFVPWKMITEIVS